MDIDAKHKAIIREEIQRFLEGISADQGAGGAETSKPTSQQPLQGRVPAGAKRPAAHGKVARLRRRSHRMPGSWPIHVML